MTQPSRELRLQVDGMTCASCTAAVERTLRAQPGVSSATVQLLDGTARVRTEERSADEKSGATLADAVTAAGYPARVLSEDEVPPPPDVDREASDAGRRARLAWVLSTPWVIGMVGMPFGVHLAPPAWVQAVVAGAILVGPGRTFFAQAWRAARGGRTHMDTLVALGAGVSYLYSLAAWRGLLGRESPIFFESAAFLIAFIALGKWLETRARARTQGALVALLERIPRTAVRLVGSLRDGEEETVEVDDLATGDRVVVLPGEAFPADGVVRLGGCATDESMLTGESVPVRKEKWDDVYGGTVVVSGGRTVVEVTAHGNATALAGIVRQVREAQSHAAPIQRVADQLSAIFVPTVIALATLTFGAWWWALDASLVKSLTHACAVIVIACPCALGLATPTAIMVGSTLGLERGILVKNGGALEALARAKVLYFDKTGTVTEGSFDVDEVVTADGVDSEEVLRVAAALERGSRHPVAEALVARAERDGIDVQPAADSSEHPGLGVTGVVERLAAVVGRESFLREQGVDFGSRPHLESDASTVHVARDGQWLGAVLLSDQVRAGAVATIRALTELGIKPRLLTGDRKPVAERVAQQIGGIRVDAEVLPNEKRRVVAAARATGEIVGMVGDGINDGPALAEADVGIAIGSGTEVAKETGDLVLLRGSFGDVVRAVRLARATLRRVRQNLGWAFVYNVAGIPIAAGLLSPWGVSLRPEFAGLAMALSSVSVVTSSLLLRTRASSIFAPVVGDDEATA
ncbi:MAG: heavy metal translocating P-type ATPase [Planctomycetota bacterium]